MCFFLLQVSSRKYYFIKSLLSCKLISIILFLLDFQDADTAYILIYNKFYNKWITNLNGKLEANKIFYIISKISDDNNIYNISIACSIMCTWK